MIAHAKLIETIREYNGEDVETTEWRIDRIAHRIDVQPVYDDDSHVTYAWHDDDADAICLVIQGKDIPYPGDERTD